MPFDFTPPVLPDRPIALYTFALRKYLCPIRKIGAFNYSCANF